MQPTGSESETQSVKSSVTYKPYSLKEFKSLKEQTKQQRLGGLGANIGSDNWQEAQKKK